MKSRHICLFVLIWLSGGLLRGQSVVKIVGDTEGHGIAVRRGSECRVITLGHVVGAAPAPQVTIPHGGHVTLNLLDRAEVLLTLPDGTSVPEDIVLFKPSARQNEVCDDNLARFKGMPSVFVATTDGASNYGFHDISLERSTPKALFFTFTKELPGQVKSMSGAPILRSGSLSGIVVRLSTRIVERGEVGYSVELLAKEFGDWVRGEDVPVAKAEESLAVLDRIRSQLPSADMGQVAALKSLSSSGGRLSGVDLRGFYFDNAHFSGMDLTGSDLTATALSQASFDKSVFTKAIFDFAVGQGVKIAGGTLDQTHHQYSNYDNADFSGASLRQSNLYFATLRNSTLSQVDFSGANLSYADLSGADITEARFDNAILYGANLSGVKGLATARFANTSVTNMVGATGRKFTESEVCGHYIGAGGFDYMKVVSMTPSPRFDDGFKYDVVGKEGAWNYMPATLIGMAHYHFLRPCSEPPPDQKAVGVQYRYLKNHSTLSIGVDRRYPSSLLQKRGIGGHISRILEARNDDLLRLLAKRDYVVPESDRDKDLAAYIERLTVGIQSARVDCLDGETLRHLIRANAGASEGLIYDDIFKQIIDEGQKLYALEEYEKTTGVAVERSLLLPFGTLLPNPTPAREVREFTNLSLGLRTIAAYRKWSARRLKQATYAFCIGEWNSPAGNADYGPAHFVADPLDLGVAAVAKIASTLQSKPTFFAGYGFLSSRYTAVGLYFDQVPPMIAANAKDIREGIKGRVDKSKQYQALVAIDSVERVPDVPLLLLRLRFKGEQITSLLRASK